MTPPASLTLEVPPGRLPERRYAADVIFRELLGIECAVIPGTGDSLSLRCAGASGTIVIGDGLLGVPGAVWLQRGSVPSESHWWTVPDVLRRSGGATEIPMVHRASAMPRDAGLDADLFGTAFFLLTRYEEVAAPAPGKYGRHEPSETLAGKEGWISRPVVNEIAEVLWAAIAREWPGMERRPRTFRVLVSHDVDHPRCVVGKSALRLAGGAAAAGWRRGWRSGMRRLEEWRQVHRHGPMADPCWTFDWLMSESERRGLRSAFYFIPRVAGGSEYSLTEPSIAGLMRRVVERGHEIGFHPSHRAAEDPAAFAAELNELRAAAALAGRPSGQWGGRHHFLRWTAGESWEQWDASGLDYDSSVGHSAVPGFRAGVCTEYPAFDLRGGRSLRLRERPLVVMDVSLFGAAGLALDLPAAVDHAIGLGRTCRRFGGDFVFLWHNNYLRSPEEREAYLAILDGVGQG